MSKVSLDLPQDLHERLRAVSHRKGVSLNQLIIEAVGLSLSRDEGVAEDVDALTWEVRQARAALGDLVIELDGADAAAAMLPPAAVGPAEDAVASLPKLTPPLSETVSEGREDRV